MMNRTVFRHLVLCAAFWQGSAPLHADDEVISLSGDFGSFIQLGATEDEVVALGPDRIEVAAGQEQRVSSKWYYFNDHGIRVRVCDDDQRLGAVNAGATDATEAYVTEAGVRVGDSLKKTVAAYGDALELMPDTNGAIWFVHDHTMNHRLTFGFQPDGVMAWIALGALRANGWTCGREKPE